MDNPRLQPGTLVIMSQADTPCAFNVAVLTGYENGAWYGHYLAHHHRKTTCYSETEPTPVEDFRVRVTIGARHFEARRYSDLKLVAKYKDGYGAACFSGWAQNPHRLRAWQSSGGYAHHTCQDAKRLLESMQ